MKCMSCGAEIADYSLICPNCGHEIQIVPDYNPLDDVLTAQVKGAVSETLRINIDQEQLEKYRAENRRTTDRVSTGGKAYQRKVGADQGVENPYISSIKRMEEEELERERRARRRKEEKKKLIAKRKRQKIMMIAGGATIVLIGLGVLGYVNSYGGRLNSGYKKLESQEFAEAEVKFEKAIKQKRRRSEAYVGLSQVYVTQGELEKAEQLYIDAISEFSNNADLYEALIKFYLDTAQETKIMPLLSECKDEGVVKKLEKYVSEGPEFSLDEGEIYDEVQALELTGNGRAIYYTLDGTDPTTLSTQYTEPIRVGEGETDIRAISVNAEGVPSMVVQKVYSVEFPIEEAPSVTPSTGQYDQHQKIKIVVPEGYVAYYTTDGSDPTISDVRIQYSGPFDMPEGNTVLNVALMNQKGRYSDITKRSYELIIFEE